MMFVRSPTVPDGARWLLRQSSRAQLIMNLLSGATLDEDEQSGLRILQKDVSSNILDDTLQELENRRKFGKLFDDYHGSEYVEMIDLLAGSIARIDIKRLFLDKFLSMCLVNRDEEQAIVVLLERTPRMMRQPFCRSATATANCAAPSMMMLCLCATSGLPIAPMSAAVG